MPCIVPVELFSTDSITDELFVVVIAGVLMPLAVIVPELLTESITLLEKGLGLGWAAFSTMPVPPIAPPRRTVIDARVTVKGFGGKGPTAAVFSILTPFIMVPLTSRSMKFWVKS